MKIGILTFHWATNYGAILQAFCLQEYLVSQGHEVEIVNYKPSQFCRSFQRVLFHPRLWVTYIKSIPEAKKEKLLVQFRKKYLNMTSRYNSVLEIGDDLYKYDVLISGSDQVLNPSFTLYGDDGKPSPLYWLTSGVSTQIRIGYSVSFGCTNYPEGEASLLAKKYVQSFDYIGTREQTGLAILEQLGFDGFKSITPDPTLLLGKELFKKLGIEYPHLNADYTCVYMIRHEIHIDGSACYLDDRHKPRRMEEWLGIIINATGLITDSYHGMIMAILAHVPFSVLLDNGQGSGMNDRFLTLLNNLGIYDRLTTSEEEALSILKKPIDYSNIDERIKKFSDEGKGFLKLCLNSKTYP